MGRRGRTDVRKTNPLCKSPSARAPPREPRGDVRDGGDARTYGRQIPSARAPLREPLCKSPSARATRGRTGRRGRTGTHAGTHGHGHGTVDKSCSQAYLQKSLLLALTQLRIARTKRKRKSFPVRGGLTTATPPNLRQTNTFMCT